MRQANDTWASAAEKRRGTVRPEQDCEGLNPMSAAGKTKSRPSGANLLREDWNAGLKWTPGECPAAGGGQVQDDGKKRHCLSRQAKNRKSERTGRGDSASTERSWADGFGHPQHRNGIVRDDGIPGQRSAARKR